MVDRMMSIADIRDIDVSEVLLDEPFFSHPLSMRLTIVRVGPWKLPLNPTSGIRPAFRRQGDGRTQALRVHQASGRLSCLDFGFH